MSVHWRRAFCHLALLAAQQGDGFAQDNDCVAKVRITGLGVPRMTESRRAMMRSVMPYHYRLDVTTEEKWCVNVTFNIVLRYMNGDSQPDVAVYSGSMRIRGGERAEFGELPGRREDTRHADLSRLSSANAVDTPQWREHYLKKRGSRPANILSDTSTEGETHDDPA